MRRGLEGLREDGESLSGVKKGMVRGEAGRGEVLRDRRASKARERVTGFEGLPTSRTCFMPRIAMELLTTVYRPSI